MNGKILTTLNERDSLEDMLDEEKRTMAAYNVALTEGSSKSIRKEILKNYSSCADNQFKVFSLMEERGFYTVTPAEKETIQTQAETFEKFLPIQN